MALGPGLALLLAVGDARSESLTVRPAVLAGQPAPGGGTFEHFGVESLPVVAPVNAKGQVAFFATLLRAKAKEGFFLASSAGGRIEKVALEGDPTPGAGSLSGFGKHPIPALNARGTVAFAAALVGARSVEGIFTSSGGRLSTVATTGNPAPGIPSGTLAGLDAPALNDRGDVAFLAAVRRGREAIEAMYRRAGGRLAKIVAQGDPAPTGGTFAGFGPPTINNAGVVAFAAVVEGRGVPGGVFVAEGERVTMLVGAGDDTPIGGIYAQLSERVAMNDAGTVAFTAVLKNAPAAAAIFAVEHGRARKVVALDDPAPGGGTFSHLILWPALSASGVIGWVAAVDQAPSPMAVFVRGASETARIIGIGDALPGGGTVASFGLYPLLSMSPTGGITVATAPDIDRGGLEAILVVAPPSQR
jgi:hypothetical protein